MWILCGFSPSPNGNDQDNQKEDDENDYNLFTTTLPSRLGYNLFSKELLRVDENKDIVIKSIVGNGISGDAYTLGPTEQRDDRRVDMLYLPLNAFTESLALVIIEIQKKFGKNFVGRAIRYFLDVFDATGSCPISLSYSLRVSPASDFAIPHSTKRKMTLSIPIRANRGQKVPNFIPQSPLPSTWTKTFWMKWLLCALFLSSYKKHNRQCMPSDDEDDDSSIEKEKNSIKKHVYKPTTLPSDDDDTSDDDCLISKNSFIKPSQNSYKRTLRQTRSDASTNSSYSSSFKPHMNITRSAEDLPRIHNNNYADDDDNVVLGSRYQVMPVKQKVRMSGMDLLIQREQEKAKRQKPKTNVPGKVKIEGLLSKLPQPGTHNISFQQLQLQEKKQQQKQRKMMDYNNMRMPFNNNAMLYQLPSIPISNGSLYINNNSRPSSVISNNHKRRSSSHYIPFV
ncbi:hypothetical protein G6F46_003257 [Rhizopus delemar]|uniref:Uncharacterized protein n=2 Tax=Rhizopus TaxID=4842 RepID=A0A9P6Z696_9FUNG|nr:hypothetical protein G6F55_003993 [Rhizopus delemar]KAG1546046.1 hypothetical protein G6F51_005111 [Rhizopus arrhizus]KAG1501963.1 hypothetical protein G6F54_002678 [Rhizopus delemar]KAG1517206.1 hypothetical protein G6F53_001560 [Rhizopus delemar]KAG1527447.1 hypothetical protein G6F52_001523 [Rhizopus delemar]